MIVISFGFIVLEATGEYVISYVSIGGTIILIGIIFKIYFRGFVYLTPDKLTFKRMKFSTNIIYNIRVTPSGRKVFITLQRAYDRPIILHIPKGYRKEAESTLKKWAVKNRVMMNDDKFIRTSFFKNVIFYIVVFILLILVIAILKI